MTWFLFLLFPLIAGILSLFRFTLSMFLPVQIKATSFVASRLHSCFLILSFFSLPFFLLNSSATQTVWWLKMLNVFQRIDRDCLEEQHTSTLSLSNCLVSQYMYRVCIALILTVILLGLLVALTASSSWIQWKGSSCLGSYALVLGFLFAGSSLPNTYYTYAVHLGKWIIVFPGLIYSSLIIMDLAHTVDEIFFFPHKRQSALFKPSCMSLLGFLLFTVSVLLLIHAIPNLPIKTLSFIMPSVLLFFMLICFVLLSCLPLSNGSVVSLSLVSLYSTLMFYGILPTMPSFYWTSLRTQFITFFIILLCLIIKDQLQCTANQNNHTMTDTDHQIDPGVSFMTHQTQPKPPSRHSVSHTFSPHVASTPSIHPLHHPSFHRTQKTKKNKQLNIPEDLPYKQLVQWYFSLVFWILFFTEILVDWDATPTSRWRYPNQASSTSITLFHYSCFFFGGFFSVFVHLRHSHQSSDMDIPSVWVRYLTTSFTVLLLYFWSLIAPLVIPHRFSHLYRAQLTSHFYS